MKIGDTLEATPWLTGLENDQRIEQEKSEIEDGFRRFQFEQKFLWGPVTFHALRPGDERVPDVPTHIDGPDIRLFVGEARIVSLKPALVAARASHSFLSDLDRVDLERLREVTRREYQRLRPGASSLTDPECDAIIEEGAPAAAARLVQAAVDSLMVH